VHEEIFEGDGKPYCYYYDNGKIRAEGFYFALGYDKNGKLQDEKFQGKNIEYHENGNIKDIFFFKDGLSTGEYYSYDENGLLQLSLPKK
jgi:antitoxin component YwqK of YwqJK toxin-antitoxin module